MEGRLFLDTPSPNEHLRMRLAPQSRSSFRGWLFKLQTGPHVEFHPDRIEISSGGDATIVGRRVR